MCAVKKSETCEALEEHPPGMRAKSDSDARGQGNEDYNITKWKEDTSKRYIVTMYLLVENI